MDRWPFSKFQGAGNDFIVVDDRSLLFPLDDRSLIARLCHRQLGIGADGLILLQPPSKAKPELSERPESQLNVIHADFRMRIFNADGLEAAMCGNGIRCLIAFLERLKVIQSSYRIETLDDVKHCERQGASIAVEMGRPLIRALNMSIPLAKTCYEGALIHIGVPHVVIFARSLADLDVAGAGREIRHHPLFKPEGVNVNFAAVREDGRVQLRTYERGVEDETLACGTGAVAAATIAVKKYHLQGELTIVPASNQEIGVELIWNGGEPQAAIMKGGAAFVFEGSIDLAEHETLKNRFF
ncbi:MAG: diaminopimelate epimerase [Anaerolineae bacterium]